MKTHQYCVSRFVCDCGFVLGVKRWVKIPDNVRAVRLLCRKCPAFTREGLFDYGERWSASQGRGGFITFRMEYHP